MQPIDILDVDAAILFPIYCLLLLFLTELDLEYVPGKGPVINNPIREERFG